MILSRQYSVEVVEEPTVEPVSLTAAKAHLRVDGTEEDVLIGALVRAAREKAEQITSRAFISQILRLRMDGFPCGNLASIIVPRPPLRAVQSLQYVDGDGELQTLFATDAVSPATDGDFIIDYWSEPARILPAYGRYWPTARTQPGSVVLTYEAGYPYLDSSPLDYAENVPGAVKQAMLLMIGHWFQNREEVAAREMFQVPWQCQALLDTVRVQDFRLSH